MRQIEYVERISSHHEGIHFGTGEWNPIAKQNRDGNTNGQTTPTAVKLALQHQRQESGVLIGEKDKKIRCRKIPRWS